MTPFPFAVQADDTVEAARAMMEEHGIHHLPVLREGKLGGVVSARDIGLAFDVLARRDAQIPMLVWAICTREPYVVEVDARIDIVADELANRRIGSALVTKHGKLAGILTLTDICRAYAELVREADGLDGDDDDVA